MTAPNVARRNEAVDLRDVDARLRDRRAGAAASWMCRARACRAVAVLWQASVASGSAAGKKRPWHFNEWCLYWWRDQWQRWKRSKLVWSSSSAQITTSAGSFHSSRLRSSLRFTALMVLLWYRSGREAACNGACAEACPRPASCFPCYSKILCRLCSESNSHRAGMHENGTLLRYCFTGCVF